MCFLCQILVGQETFFLQETAVVVLHQLFALFLNLNSNFPSQFPSGPCLVNLLLDFEIEDNQKKCLEGSPRLDFCNIIGVSLVN